MNFVKAKMLEEKDCGLTQWLYDCINGMYNPIGGHHITLDHRHSVDVHGGVTLKEINIHNHFTVMK